MAKGHDNINFKFQTNEQFDNKHRFAMTLHVGMVSGKLVVIAQTSGTKILHDYSRQTLNNRATLIRPQIGDGQCLVGPYGRSAGNRKPRHFTVSLDDNDLRAVSNSIRVR